MLKHIRVKNNLCTINWTPNEVCKLLTYRAIKAEQLIQEDKTSTRKLIRDLYLLACQASLKNPLIKSKEAAVLRTYAKTIKETSDYYENLFDLGDVIVE